ncbi:MAG TPA: helix-turn-helix domain-containing protein [Chitinophagaceae bacterium]|jgi:Transcriptional regulator
MAKKVITGPGLSTEEKIIEAARKVFTQKGYSATRTRDIAEEAGLNLALLNYYFRSKEKLFEIVMMEKMLKFFGVMAPVLNDAATTLENKVKVIAEKYTELLLENPDLPLFILSEIRNSPRQFLSIVQKANFLNGSVFIKQIQMKRPDLNPLQFLVSLLGMCVFPYVMKPVLQMMSSVSEKEFTRMMKERKTLIPAWTKAILKAK